MRKLLSEPLMRLLSSLDYRYLLARRNTVLSGDANVCITLTPVKVRPTPGKFPEDCYDYFEIGAQLLKMAADARKTIMVVDIGEVNLCQVIESYLSQKDEKSVNPG